MDYSKILTVEDLDEPYDLLIDFLALDDIKKIEAELAGRYINFKLNLDDNDEQYAQLQNMVGKEKALKIMKRFSGSRIYFPAFRKACAAKIKKMIIDEFNGYNYAKLAKTYGYTERSIRRIVVAAKKNTVQ